MSKNNYKPDYDNYHPSLWKKGNQHYHFHTPLEYEIVAKATDPKIRQSQLFYKVADSEILIRPLSIGEDKAKEVKIRWEDYKQNGKEYLGGKATVILSHYEFWIPRRMIRRGPGSFKINEDRWVHKDTFYRCLTKMVTKGDPFYESTYY